VHFGVLDPRLKLSHLHPRNYSCLNGMRSGRPERQYSRHAEHISCYQKSRETTPLMLLSQNGAKGVKPPCLAVSPTLRHTCHNASSVCDQVKRMALHPPVRILVIDDEPSIVQGLAKLLRREGYRVATAANGRHALAQLQVQPYDVILSDLHMPELDGQAFYALLRQQYPALCARVIFFKIGRASC